MEQIEAIVQTHLPTVSPNIGAAVGFASPSFGAHILCIGSLVDQLGDPMAFTTDTPFEIASLTKTVTASVYERLIQTGRIRRMDTLGRYITREVSPKIRAIPLFDIADYTSGLPADDQSSNDTVPPFLNGDYTEADLFDFLANPTFPISAPGTAYTYSNLGFSLLAIALQDATRENSFATLVNQEILGVLGMVKTQSYSTANAALLPRGFDASGNPTGTGWQEFPAYLGAGGLVSTPNEMMTWLQFNMGIIQFGSLSGILSVVHSPATVGVANLSANTLPGLGWFVSNITSTKGSRLAVVQKNGDLAGFSSQIAFLQAQGGCASSAAGVFALVNGGNATATRASAATDIAYDLLFAITGD